MKRIGIYLLSTFLFFACTEKVLEPISKGIAVPGIVADVRVTNISGGAVIEYKIPQDNDLLYIKANYTITNGSPMEVKASMYEKSLVIKGFNDQDASSEYTVSLVSVSKSNVESSPVLVKINPLKSPLNMLKESVKISQAFGGAQFTWENAAEEPITLYIMADTVLTEGAQPGPMVEARILKTDKKGEYIIRGYPDKSRAFGLIAEDNYGNQTELIQPQNPIVPFKEMFLNKKNMRIYEFGELPADCNWAWWEGLPSKLLDNDKSWTSVAISYQSPYPRYFTIDLGDVYILSRYVMHQRYRGGSAKGYDYGNPKKWAVYGRVEAPDPKQEILEDLDGDGNPDWTRYWVKIGDHEIIKPSGLPVGQMSQEDIEALDEGHNFDIPLGLGGLRYFRIGIFSNWDNAGWCNFSEIDFLGIKNIN